jgi:hypothetical protein
VWDFVSGFWFGVGVSLWGRGVVFGLGFLLGLCIQVCLFICFLFIISKPKNKSRLFDYLFISLLFQFPRPPLWSSVQSSWLQIQGSRVRFPDTTKKSSGSATGSTQPHEYN